MYIGRSYPATAIISAWRATPRLMLGGWESADMVRRYGHLSSDHLAGYVDRLAAFQLTKSGLSSYDLATVNKKGLENIP